MNLKRKGSTWKQWTGARRVHKGNSNGMRRSPPETCSDIHNWKLQPGFKNHSPITSIHTRYEQAWAWYQLDMNLTSPWHQPGTSFCQLTANLTRRYQLGTRAWRACDTSLCSTRPRVKLRHVDIFGHIHVIVYVHMDISPQSVQGPKHMLMAPWSFKSGPPTWGEKQLSSNLVGYGTKLYAT